MLRRFVFYWLPIFLWMAMIFMGSTDVLSSRRTSRWIGPVLRWFNPDISLQTIQRVQYAVRKFGHTLEFGVLACLFWRVLRPGPSPGRFFARITAGEIAAPNDSRPRPPPQLKNALAKLTVAASRFQLSRFSLHFRARVLTALLLTFLYAVTDEYHQAFYPSREAAFRDVVIDTVGACLGLALFLFLERRRSDALPP